MGSSGQPATLCIGCMFEFTNSLKSVLVMRLFGLKRMHRRHVRQRWVTQSVYYLMTGHLFVRFYAPGVYPGRSDWRICAIIQLLTDWRQHTCLFFVCIIKIIDKWYADLAIFHLIIINISHKGPKNRHNLFFWINIQYLF